MGGSKDGIISEILEQDSLEIDTPMQQPRIEVVSSKNQSNRRSSTSCVVPDYFVKEQVDPVKVFKKLSPDQSKKQVAAAVAPTQGGPHRDYLKLMQERKKGRIKQRKNSQMTNSKGGNEFPIA